MESQLLSTIRFMATSAAVTVVIVVQLFAADALQLTSRQPWMDEIHTLELVGDKNVEHMLGALADGADFNPPGYYIMARSVASMFGSTDVEVLRSFSLLCILLGLIAIAMMLQRQVTFTVAIAVVAALWAQTLLVDQSLEARFYAPWFGLLAWYCWFASRKKHNPLLIAAGCLLAIAICTVHYFGVISLLMVTAGIVMRRPAAIKKCAVWLPAVIGIAAIACCYPFYVGQKAALTVPTWISPPDLQHIQRFLNNLLPFTTTLIAIIAVIVSGLIAKTYSSGDTESSRSETPQASWTPTDQFPGAIMLALFPLLLIIFSYTIQPALVPRYSLIFLIGCAPFLAWLLQHVRPPILIPVAICFVVLGVTRTADLRDRLVALDTSRLQMVESLRNTAGGLPVAFEDRIDSFPLIHLAGRNAANWYFVNFKDSALREASAIRTVQRDVARRFALWYPKYKLASIDELQLRDRFYLVPYPQESTEAIDYGPYRSEQLTERLYQMRRIQVGEAFQTTY